MAYGWGIRCSLSMHQSKIKRFPKSQPYRVSSSSCKLDWANITDYNHLNSQTLTASSFAAKRMLYIPRGGYLPAGWNPFGYLITSLGLKFLEFDGSLDSDLGRFLASLKSGRKNKTVLKAQWLEIVRVSKSGQSMRILRKLDEFIDFCVKAGFIA